MSYKVGFIGAGNMGSALIKGIASKGFINPSNIYVSSATFKRASALAQEVGCNAVADNTELTEKCDIVILAVKPNFVKKVLQEIKPSFSSDKIFVTIAVGIPISFYASILGDNTKIIRTMPNTPALVGEGMTLVTRNDKVSDDEFSYVRKMLECTGLVEELEERLMSEVTALTSSSPAYVFMFIEAMADAAVQSGIPRALSYRLAAQAVLGSARMVIESGKHPGELKDQVCSPAGTTIEAVYSLEKNGFRGTVMEAMDCCTKKAIEIGRKFN